MPWWRVQNRRTKPKIDLTTPRLLPPDTLRWMRRAFCLSNRFGMTPFQWIETEICPKREIKGWRVIVWIFNLLLTSFHIGFALRQCYHTMRNDRTTLTSKVFVVFTVLWSVHSLILQISNILRRDSLPVYTKTFIGFLKDLRDFASPGESLPAVKIGRILLMMALNSGRTLTVLYGCVALVQPTIPAFWSSIFPTTHEIWPMRALLAFMELYLAMLMCEAWFIYITTSFPYVFALLDILRLMSVRMTEGYRQVTVRKMFQLYQQLRLLTLAQEQVIAIMLVSMKVCFIGFGMFGTYGCFRTKGMMSVFFGGVGGFCIVFLVVYMMLLGEVHSRATGFLSVVKTAMATERRRDDVMWTRRKMRSMPAIRIKVGSMYYIDKPIVMTTCRILFDSCINFLLMTA